MKHTGETTLLKSEGDHEVERSVESNTADVIHGTKQEPEDKKHKVVVETHIDDDEVDESDEVTEKTTGSMFLAFPVEDSYYCEKCKLKYEGACPEHGPFIYVDSSEGDHGQVSTKGVSNQVSRANSLGKLVPRMMPGIEALQQSGLCEEMHTCAQCFLLFSKLEYLQTHEELMHGDMSLAPLKHEDMSLTSLKQSDMSLTPRKNGKHSKMLPEGKKKKGNKILNIVDKILNMKSESSVPEVARQQGNTKPRGVKNVARVDLSGLREHSAALHGTRNDRKMVLKDGSCSRVLDQALPLRRKNAQPYTPDTSGALQRKAKANIREKVNVGGHSSPCNDCGVGVCHCSNLVTQEEIDTEVEPTYDDDGEFGENLGVDSQLSPHAEPKAFKCHICGVGFTRESHLFSHQRVHTGEKPYKCDVCGSTFAQTNNLRRHKRVHTAEYPYKCDVCGVAFAESSNLKRHKRIHTGEKLYKCEVCGVSFTECSNLKRHRRTHTKEKPFKCDVCGVGFAVGCSLKTHRRVHTGEKPYSCDICGVAFAQSSNLKKHKWTHAPDKPYKCDVCGSGYSDKSSLKTHQRKHTGEKPYKCDLCEFGFAEAGSLHRHKVLHTGEKPFKCDICGAKFTDNSNLKRHLRIHEREKS